MSEQEQNESQQKNQTLKKICIGRLREIYDVEKSVS